VEDAVAMTGRHRIEAALRGEAADAVPIFLRDLTLGLDICDYTTPEVCAGGPNGAYDAEKSARCVVETQRLLGHDCVVGSIHDLGLDVDVLGGRVEFPERGIPYVAEPAFVKAEKVLDARTPDLRRQGRMPGVLRSYQLVSHAIGDRVSIAANVEGPVTKAGLLRGLDTLLLDMVRDPDAARAAVEVAVQLACEHVRALLDAGAHFVFIAAASDGPAAIRPKDYLQYTVPGLARIVAAAHERRADVVFHPHGPFTHERFWPLVDAAIETGIAGFQFGENNDLVLARHRWGRRVCILGGPDIKEVLLPGPADRVYSATEELLSAAAGQGGFVLMPSCSIHRGFPLEHLGAMIAAARSRTLEPH
jgi:uroporphyrinogen decarboxylase